MNAGLLSTAATNAGQGNELDVVAAVVIGGASLTEDKALSSGPLLVPLSWRSPQLVILLRLPAYMQTVTIGVVISCCFYGPLEKGELDLFVQSTMTGSVPEAWAPGQEVKRTEQLINFPVARGGRET